MAGPIIALLGGTFDPIHRGHIDLAEGLATGLGLDEVLLIPAGDPPHKQIGPRGATSEQRYAMVRRATEGHPRLRVSDVEVRRAGPSYSVETIEALRPSLPVGAKIVLVLGLDAFADLPTWHRPRDLTSLSQVLVVPRRGYDLAQVAAQLGTDPWWASWLGETPEWRAPDVVRQGVLAGESPLFLNLSVPRLSSTDIRRRIREGRPIDGLVPDAVRTFILAENLYR